MKIEQLRQVIEIINAGSINRASQNLFITQSSISSSIRALEQELGHKIFLRTPRGVSLTKFGQIFVEHAKEALTHIDKIEMAASEEQSEELSPYLAIGIYFLMFASYPLTQLHNKYKNIGFSFNYLEKTRSDIVSLVLAQEVEIGLLMMYSVDREKWMSMFNSQGIDYFRLTVQQPFAAVGAVSEFFNDRYTTITPKLLANRKMIVVSEHSELFAAIERNVNKRFSPSGFLKVCDRGSFVSVLNQTDSFMLAAYNKKAYSKVDFYQNIKVLPIIGADFTCEIGYIKLQNRSLSRFGEEYIQMITDMIA